MISQLYEYNATVVRVVDADTIRVVIDLGFEVSFHVNLRLAGINAPENSTAEGKDATTYVKSLLGLGTKIVVRTTKDRQDKYGRYLAEVIFPETQESLNKILLDKGLAVPYM